MKKLFLILISAMCTSILFAQSCATLTQVSANYDKQEVTFKLQWGACTGTHYNRVWVFVDYRSVMSPAVKGTWARAAISSSQTPTVTAGNATIVPADIYANGFFVTGNTSATVKVKLNVPASQFDWCAFATDYPPNATLLSGNTYTLKGTPPFTYTTANGTFTTIERIYDGVDCITSITDATKNPEGIVGSAFNAGAITSSSVNYTTCNNVAGNPMTQSVAPSGGAGNYIYQWVVSFNAETETTIAGATATTYTPPAITTGGTYVYRRLVIDACGTAYSAGTVTRIVRPDFVTITCSGASLDVKSCDAGKFTWTSDRTSGCPSGWYRPTTTQLACIIADKDALNISGSGYWSYQSGVGCRWLCGGDDTKTFMYVNAGTISQCGRSCATGPGLFTQAFATNSFSVRCVR